MATQALTYICKIKNHDQVADALDRMGLACSKLWNVALYHTHQVWEKESKIPSAYDTQKAVQDHFWYKQLPGHTAQAVTQELWQAYKSWFRHRRNGNPQARPPGYRKRNGKVPLSMVTVKRYGFRLESTILRLSRGLQDRRAIPVPGVGPAARSGDSQPQADAAGASQRQVGSAPGL